MNKRMINDQNETKQPNTEPGQQTPMEKPAGKTKPKAARARAKAKSKSQAIVPKTKAKAGSSKAKKEITKQTKKKKKKTAQRRHQRIPRQKMKQLLQDKCCVVNIVCSVFLANNILCLSLFKSRYIVMYSFTLWFWEHLAFRITDVFRNIVVVGLLML